MSMIINQQLFCGGSSNLKKFTKTVSAIQQNIYTFAIGDSDIAQHYSDSNAICIIIPITSIAAAPALLGGINGNRALGTDSTYGTLYGSMNMRNGSAVNTTLPRFNYPLNGNASVSANTRGVIEADANGDIKIICSGTAPLQPGTYEIYFVW